MKKLSAVAMPEEEEEEEKRSEGVSANIMYLKNNKIEAIYNASTAGEAKEANHEGQYSSHVVNVTNARLEAYQHFCLDRQGFLLAEHVSPVSDFHDDDVLRDTYNSTVEELVKNITGASRVVVFDHTRRAASEELRVSLKCREPSRVVHNDYTPFSAERRLCSLFPEEFSNILEGRYAIVNVWRSIAGPVLNHHMAFCDSESQEVEDCVAVKRISKDKRVGEIQMAVFNPDHRWFYFPELLANEVLIFKTFDSEENINRFTLHTAFVDPTAPECASPRQSLETRCFVFF